MNYGERLQYLIDQEISSYYLPDELPAEYQAFQDELPNLAKESAGRLVRLVQREDIPALANLLRDMAQNEDHPLLLSIMNSSLVDWSEDPDNHLLQRLLSMIAHELLAWEHSL